ncbi:carbon-nitrogen hydrolase family protein [Streptomyces sp. NPDC006368]|uniref:carbon-nitrogen hydrolase family protein n=1 Tax=Streptomyces sp. NPDC006368 TaxID=3156760 RepID=UPI0033AF6333
MWTEQSPTEQLPSRVLRVAAAQACPVAGDVEANAGVVAAMVREAAEGGARVVVFPEKFLTGYEPGLIAAEPERCAVQVEDGRLRGVQEACRESGVVAVVGAAVHDGVGLYVSALVIDGDGRLAGRYDKQTLFAAEREVYRHGEAGCTVEVDGWRLGLGVCYDAGFPEHARGAVLDGCHAYLVGALFGVGKGHHESRMWFPARAFDNTMYAVLANHVGHTGGWHTCGGSAVWGPDGRLVVEAGPDKRQLVFADLSPDVLRAARAAHTMVRDLRDTSSAPRTRYRL